MGFEFLGVEIAIVNRTHLRGLPEKGDVWSRGGAYILLNPTSDDGSTGTYVGHARDLTIRLTQHTALKPEWRRAVLIRRTGQEQFSTAHAEWLEAALHTRMSGAPNVMLSNVRIPANDSIPNADAELMRPIVTNVMGVLLALGVNVDRPAKKKILKPPMVTTADDAEDTEDTEGGGEEASPVGASTWWLAVYLAALAAQNVTPTPHTAPDADPVVLRHNPTPQDVTLADLLRVEMVQPGAVLRPFTNPDPHTTVVSLIVQPDGQVTFEHDDNPAQWALKDATVHAQIFENVWHYWADPTVDKPRRRLQKLAEQFLRTGHVPDGFDPNPTPETTPPSADTATHPDTVIPLTQRLSDVWAAASHFGPPPVRPVATESLGNPAPIPVTPPVKAAKNVTAKSRGKTAAPGEHRPAAKLGSGRSEILALMDRGHLKAGQRLHATYRNRQHHLKVQRDGNLLVDGTALCDSFSGAKNHITMTGGNGWSFWYTDQNIPVHVLRIDDLTTAIRLYREEQAENTKAKAKKKKKTTQQSTQTFPVTVRRQK
ncbi:hypothetical protein RHODO2019_18505 (plasmid) [Rhodococcus antarcticus]|uniref:RAMA domain-containing protein n=1 Tax=Rhodococcus antarcticus TaxID=2987751 RepID=A0ABY6P5N2_9NOCA|nr:hypothetical protein [Rhodococcus antarcticus]UZJ26984.1 hypothetical protein RHODO2019_18505 [Rhodococcus antarcticus]